MAKKFFFLHQTDLTWLEVEPRTSCKQFICSSAQNFFFSISIWGDAFWCPRETPPFLILSVYLHKRQKKIFILRLKREKLLMFFPFLGQIKPRPADQHFWNWAKDFFFSPKDLKLIFLVQLLCLFLHVNVFKLYFIDFNNN